jgi:hypothetical protein
MVYAELWRKVTSRHLPTRRTIPRPTSGASGCTAAGASCVHGCGRFIEVATNSLSVMRDDELALDRDLQWSVGNRGRGSRVCAVHDLASSTTTTASG